MCVFQKGHDEALSSQRIVSENSFKKPLHNGVYETTTTSKNGGNLITMSQLKFNVNVSDLKELMELKGVEAKEKLEERFGSAELLASQLKTDIQNGISATKEDLDMRVKLYGKNEIPPKPPKSFIRLAFEAVQDTTLIMLITCAILSISLSFYHPEVEKIDEEFGTNREVEEANLEWVEGVAIMIAVIVVVFVTAFNDWRKERQFRGLQDRIESDHLTSVIRNGKIIQINVKHLVVGDICCIKYGDLIPADGIIVQSSDLKIDESSLTGETDLIKKNLTDNLTILSGTHVMEGTGQFLVLAVGLNSQTGIIMTLLGATKADNKDPENKTKTKTKKHRSVLQIKLGKLALQIGYGGMIAALCTFIILVARMFVKELIIEQKPWSNKYIKYILSFLTQGLTVIVVAVPEGLPLAVTLALAFAVRKMTSDNNLVRHLDACETMGSATTICSDKTGTLTTNRMTAVQCWVGETYHKKIPDKSKINQNIRELIYESISTNTNYTSIIQATTQTGEIAKQIGNKTECGLLGFVNDIGGNYEQIRTKFPSEHHVKVYTFNSARKMMSTIIKNGPGFRLCTKGASEIVLNKCGYYLNADGQPNKLDQENIDKLIRTVVEPMASEGLRTICLAYRDFMPKTQANQNENDINVTFYDTLPDWDAEDEILKDLTCLSLVGIEDPVRIEVPEAIRNCQTSGVVVRMVTGDNIATATSIALKCGIVKPTDDFLILESKEFNKRIRDDNGVVIQEKLDQVWPRLRVLARSSPQDKYILVNGIVESKISANREVVAVTGDGTNDGPALKRADVGFAMGIQGTDVAKEASDIILTDDNFSSIVKAMMWGRNVYDAIAKFLQFQLTANFSAGIFSVVCAATIQAVPLKAVQMLWVNLVMDTFASLALATEPPTPDLLKRKPYGRTKNIISLTMLKNMIGHTIYQLVVLFCLVYFIEDWMLVDSVIKYNDITKLRDPSLHFTIIFNAFVLMTLFNEINARKIHNERNVFAGIQNNSVFLVIWICCFIGQILIVNFGGIIFAVERIGLDHWMWCFLFGVGSLLWGQIVVSIPKSATQKLVYVFCKKTKKEAQNQIGENLNVQRHVRQSEEMENDHEYINKATVLWIRGASRIQNELQVIEAFRSKLNDSSYSDVGLSHESTRSLNKKSLERKEKQ